MVGTIATALAKARPFKYDLQKVQISNVLGFQMVRFQIPTAVFFSLILNVLKREILFFRSDRSSYWDPNNPIRINALERISGSLHIEVKVKPSNELDKLVMVIPKSNQEINNGNKVTDMASTEVELEYRTFK